MNADGWRGYRKSLPLYFVLQLVTARNRQPPGHHRRIYTDTERFYAFIIPSPATNCISLFQHGSISFPKLPIPLPFIRRVLRCNPLRPLQAHPARLPHQDPLRERICPAERSPKYQRVAQRSCRARSLRRDWLSRKTIPCHDGYAGNGTG